MPQNLLKLLISAQVESTLWSWPVMETSILSDLEGKDNLDIETPRTKRSQLKYKILMELGFMQFKQEASILLYKPQKETFTLVD